MTMTMTVPPQIEREAEELLMRGEISNGHFSRILNGTQTIEEVKEETSRMIEESKPKKQASANGEKKRKSTPRKEKEVKEKKERGPSYWQLGINRSQVEKAKAAADVAVEAGEIEEKDHFTFASGFAEFIVSGMAAVPQNEAYLKGFAEAERQYRSKEKGTITKVLWNDPEKPKKEETK